MSSRQLAFAGALLATAVVLLYRSIGLYPVVLGDEQIYSAAARLSPLAESPIPNYLYLQVFRTTNYCGPNFLSCARILNTLFFIGALPFIYLIARRLSHGTIAAWITVLIGISPINSYTAYFMPESLYFLGFWVLSWLLLIIDGIGRLRSWTAIGAVLGLTMLVKPHALFMFPAIVLYTAVISGWRKPGNLRSGIARIGLLGASAISVKFAVGAMLAGAQGVSFLGPLYGGIAESSTRSVSGYFAIALGAIENAGGHVLALAVLYGLPIAVALLTVLRGLGRQADSGIASRVALLALLVLGNLIVVTALFTASVAGNGPYESASRLHMRYYNFALPLLPLLVLACLESDLGRTRDWRRIVIGALLAALGAYALYTRLEPFTPGLVDSPELRGITLSPTAFLSFATTSVLLIVLWAYRSRPASTLFVFAWFPAVAVLSTYDISVEQRQHIKPNAYDRAGKIVNQLLDPKDLERTLILGSEPIGLYRALFHLDHRGAQFRVLAPSDTIDVATVAPDRDWLLVFGTHDLSPTSNAQLTIGGARLIRLSSDRDLDFSKGSWTGIVQRSQGLSNAEPWGTWSIGSRITIEFIKPLPQRFRVRLTAFAFGPNVELPFRMRVGSNSVEFRVAGESSSQELLIENETGSAKLEILIPAPISPAQLGLSPDQREIGLGLQLLEIEPAPLLSDLREPT